MAVHKRRISRNKEKRRSKKYCTRCRKKKYLSGSKRRQKVKVKGKRSLSKSYVKINIRNRKWSRLSVYPFVNYLRKFKRKFDRNTPIEEIAVKAGKAWNRLPKYAKKCYVKQAIKARSQGYRS